MNNQAMTGWIVTALSCLEYVLGCGPAKIVQKCENICSPAGLSECADGKIRSCLLDAAGCLNWTIWAACESGTCADAVSCAGCNNGCAVGGNTRCASGSLYQCEADASGCLDWGAAIPCATGSCADGERCAGCANSCPSAGMTECNDGKIRTCVADSQNCLAWSQTANCSSGTCLDDKTCDGEPNNRAFIFSRQMSIGAWAAGVTDNEPPLCDLHGPNSEEAWCKNRIDKTIAAMKVLNADAVLLNVRSVYYLAERWPDHPCSTGADGVVHYCPGAYNENFGQQDGRARWGFLDWTLKRFAEEGINVGIVYAMDFSTYNGAPMYDSMAGVYFGGEFNFWRNASGSSKGIKIDPAYPVVRDFLIDMTAWIANTHPDLRGIKFEEPGYWMNTGSGCVSAEQCESWSPPIIQYVNDTYGYVPTKSNWTVSTGPTSDTVQNHMIMAGAHFYDLVFEGIRNKITRHYPDFYLFGEFQRYNFADGPTKDRSLGLNLSKYSDNKWIDIAGGEYGGNGGGWDKTKWCDEYSKIEKYADDILVTNGVSIYQSGIYNEYALDQINHARTCRANNFERIFEWRFADHSTGGSAEIKANINTWLQTHAPLPPYSSTLPAPAH